MSSLKDRIAASRKSIADRNASFDRAYKFKVGKTTIRLLPGVSDPDEFSKEYGSHYIRDPQTDAIIAVVGDASICYGKPDPVREAIGQVIDQCNARGNDAGAEKAKSWLAKATNVTNIQIVAGPDTENKDKVVRAEFSSNGLDAINSILEDYIATDPEFEEKFRQRGFLINVERVGTGKMDTKYTYSAYPKQPENPVPEAVNAQRVDLQTVVDSKFGQSVLQALTKLSAILGKDVTGTALGAAMTETAKLVAPASEAAAPLAEEDLTALLGEGPIEAEFVDATETPKVDAVVTEAVAPTAAAAEEFSDILAELEGL
jgi:hypothetical protein